MVIEKLYLNDFRGIHELELEMQGKSTVLFGINGVGKSSVLAAINLLYANIINRLVKQRFKQPAQMGISDIKCGKAAAKIRADFRFGNENEVYTYVRKIDNKGIRIHHNKELENIVSHFEERYLIEDEVDDDNNLVQQGGDL